MAVDYRFECETAHVLGPISMHENTIRAGVITVNLSISFSDLFLEDIQL
jgi:hypothetical protein